MSNVVDEAFQLNDARPRPPSLKKQKEEKERCASDPLYFINTYCKLLDSVASDWVAFKTWPAQEEALRGMLDEKYTIVLKARQLGLTWLFAVAYSIWKMLYRPIAIVIIISKGEKEALDVIERLKGMYDRLPDWMRAETTAYNTEKMQLANGSTVFARTANSGGRSASANLVVIDEADYVMQFKELLAAAKPTIDAGRNQMIVLSTAAENTPNSLFKRMCLGAMKNEIDWHFIFLPWWSHPARTKAWYESELAEKLYTQGTPDSVYKEYPGTVNEALAGASTNNRFPSGVLSKFYAPRMPLDAGPSARPSYPSIRYYAFPLPDHAYVLGVDCAEGLTGTEYDDAVIQVLDRLTLEQVAVVAGRITPTTLAQIAAELADFYNHARMLPERNNHGLTFMEALRALKARYHFSVDKDLKNPTKEGWMTSKQSKIALYDNTGNVFQSLLESALAENAEPDPIIYDTTTSVQLGAIQLITEDNRELSAPVGQHDDHAMAYVLAMMCARPRAGSMMMMRHNMYGGMPELPSGDGQSVSSLPQDVAAKLKARGIHIRR